MKHHLLYLEGKKIAPPSCILKLYEYSKTLETREAALEPLVIVKTSIVLVPRATNRIIGTLFPH